MIVKIPESMYLALRQKAREGDRTMVSVLVDVFNRSGVFDQTFSVPPQGWHAHKKNKAKDQAA